MTIVRVAAHADDGVIVLHTDPRDRHVMGGYLAARYSPAASGYLLPEQRLPSFAAYAEGHGLVLVDERRGAAGASSTGTGTVGVYRPLQECADCGQPAKRDDEPRFCTACGKPWHGVEWSEQPRDLRPQRTCRDCGHVTTGAFPFCAMCGGALDPTPAPKRLDWPPPNARDRLDDPVPIADVIDELHDEWNVPW